MSTVADITSLDQLTEEQIRGLKKPILFRLMFMAHNLGLCEPVNQRVLQMSVDELVDEVLKYRAEYIRQKSGEEAEAAPPPKPVVPAEEPKEESKEEEAAAEIEEAKEKPKKKRTRKSKEKNTDQLELVAHLEARLEAIESGITTMAEVVKSMSARLDQISAFSETQMVDIEQHMAATLEKLDEVLGLFR